MWNAGVWHVPTRVLDRTVVLRLEYDTMIEPQHIRQFREDQGGLYNFTWVPNGVRGLQELFYRRWWEGGSWAVELLVWDVYENTRQSVYLNGISWGLMLATFADFSAVGDSRGAAKSRSDRKATAARLEHGDDAPGDLQHGQKWYDNQTPARVWQRSQREKVAHLKARNPEQI